MDPGLLMERMFFGGIVLQKSKSEFLSATDLVLAGNKWRISHDLALAISPSLKIEVYKCLYDCLLKYRNSSGDSYKRMVVSLYSNSTQRSTFSEYIPHVCKLIQCAVGVSDWQKATEVQLEYRDKIHEYVSLMCGIFHHNNDEAVRIGLLRAKEWYDSRK